ncbi:hypothetical protein BCL69_105918 [Nitrosomonas communis]|uniref:Uncharacterized protein n=1 Tax=Nitrosomonas communis TaxID=44574 RepID=A0A5D3Y8M6_9PROT|nr:hypothetical protein BCL69_105918 [Nitrosomonas communis]
MVSSGLVNREVGSNHTEISAPSQAMAVEILNVFRESVIPAKKVLNQGLKVIIQG